MWNTFTYIWSKTSENVLLLCIFLMKKLQCHFNAFSEIKVSPSFESCQCKARLFAKRQSVLSLTNVLDTSSIAEKQKHSFDNNCCFASNNQPRMWERLQQRVTEGTEETQKAPCKLVLTWPTSCCWNGFECICAFVWAQKRRRKKERGCKKAEFCPRENKARCVLQNSAFLTGMCLT